jgi:hypothetical protein
MDKDYMRNKKMEDRKQLWYDKLKSATSKAFRARILKCLPVLGLR